jgi:hypothetical protein
VYKADWNVMMMMDEEVWGCGGMEEVEEEKAGFAKI